MQFLERAMGHDPSLGKRDTVALSALQQQPQLFGIALDFMITVSEPLPVALWNWVNSCGKLISHVQAGNCNPRVTNET